MNYTMKRIPHSDRPRERLYHRGPESLSTRELLAIILSTGGVPGNSALDLARDLLAQFSSLQGIFQATMAELCSIKGLGKVKAAQLKASLYLGSKMSASHSVPSHSIQSPLQAYELLKEEFEGESREKLVALFCNTRKMFLGIETIAIGNLNMVSVHPRELFYPAIRHKAASLILAHNHPTGDLSPSQADLEMTQTFLEMASLLHIPIEDHLIIGQKDYLSMRENEFFSF